MSVSEPNYQGMALRVCVDCTEGGHVSGKVYSRRMSAPIPFADLAALLLRLDRMLDRQNFPQAFQRARSFTGQQNEACAPQDRDETMSAETVAAAKGAIAVFELHILARRNATWQGNVDWLDGSAPAPFESDLELLALLEEHKF